jgi:hypothetical protein
VKTYKAVLAACAVVLGLAVVLSATRNTHAQTLGGVPFTCGLDDIGATLTLCYTNSDPSERLYVTGIVAQSTTATAGQFILRYGTGANCGTGTVSLFPSAATAVRVAYAGNTAAPTVISLPTPLIVPAGKDLCALGVVTNTLTIQIVGERRP